MMRALYSAVLHLAQPLLRAKLTRRGAEEPGYLEAVEERFGQYASPAGVGYIWIHAVSLGEKLIAQGFAIALPHGSEAERSRSEALAAALGLQAQVWPRQDLAALTAALAACAGVVGVDSGLSHIAVALDLPHVQIYNFDTAWRTGPFGSARQRSVFAAPTPSVDAVWQAWLDCRQAAAA